MRALFCTDTYAPQVNGVSVVTEMSARGLMARGWDVEVVAPRYPRRLATIASAAGVAASVAAGGTASGTANDAPAAANPPRDAGPSVHSVLSFPAPKYADLRMAVPTPWRMAGIVRRFEPDIVHCETEFAVGRVGLWAAMRRGIPVVTSYHTNFAQYAPLYGLGRARGALERYIASVHRAARRTYTPSTASRAELWRMGVTDVEIWGRGVDLSLFSPARRSARLRTKMGVQNAFTFVHVGRLAPEKSVGVVLDAFHRLTQLVEGDSVRLIVAGSGPDEPSLRARAPRSVVFLGNLHRERELPALYASADAFVFASVTETLGLVVLEAMACGLPVIAVPAGGVSDHLRDGQNGLAVPANDPDAMARAMHRMATEPGLRERLGEGALHTARALGWDAELDRLDSSYRALCEETAMVRTLPARLGLHRA